MSHLTVVRSILQMTARIPWLGRQLALRCFLTPPRIPVRLPAEGEQLWERAQRQDFEVAGQRCTLWRWRVAQPARGSVLLMHGWSTSARCWLAYVDALVREGFEVWALDAPAHGASTGRQADLPRFIQGLHAALDHIGPVDVLIGHSLGAASIPGVLTGFGDLGPRRNAGAVVLLSAPNNAAVYTDVFAQKVGLNRRAHQALARAFDLHFGARHTIQTVGEQVGELGLPALLVHDREDSIVPVEQFEQLCADAGLSRPHLDLHTTEGLDHIGVLTDADTIERVVAFTHARCGAAA